MTGKPVLQVTMLGGFELRYDLELVQLKKRQRSKPVQLMQLLLHSRETGVSRQRLIEALYGQETGIDTANNLNATVSQLRRLLQNTILPKENYILTDIDRYRFNCSFPVHVDTEEVLALRQEAMVKEGQEPDGAAGQALRLLPGPVPARIGRRELGGDGPGLLSEDLPGEYGPAVPYVVGGSGVSGNPAPDGLCSKAVSL